MNVKSQIISRVSSGRWKKVLGSAIAVLLLAPLPVLGFTFLGSWNIVQTQINAPSVVVNSSDTANGGFLDLDFGRNPPTTSPSVSSVTASRNFHVSNSSEVVTVTDALKTLLQGANMAVTVQVRQINTGSAQGANFRNLVLVRDGSGIRFGRMSTKTGSTNVNLNGPADYNVRIKMKYTKQAQGVWDSTLPPTGSPHTFQFLGM